MFKKIFLTLVVTFVLGVVGTQSVSAEIGDNAPNSVEPSTIRSIEVDTLILRTTSYPSQSIWYQESVNGIIFSGYITLDYYIQDNDGLYHAYYSGTLYR